MPDQPPRGPGRPRKWASEAERKRAYRARRAAELAEPARMRDDARRARDELARIRSQLDAATRAAQRAEQRAASAVRRAAKLTQRLEATTADLRRARQARDDAQRLLRHNLASAKDVQRLRNDPDTLLAIIAEQRRLLGSYGARAGELERRGSVTVTRQPHRGIPR